VIQDSMERSRPKSPVSFFQVTSEPPKPLPRPFSTTDSGGSALTGSSQGSSTIKASRSNIFHGIRFPKSKSSEEREKKRSKESSEANQSMTSASGRNFGTGLHLLDNALHKGKGKSKDSNPGMESPIPESPLTPAEEYRRLHQANRTQRRASLDAYESRQEIDLAAASSRALQSLISPDHSPPRSRWSFRDNGSHDSDGQDFLNQLEEAAEDDVPSWLAGNDVKTSNEPPNAD